MKRRTHTITLPMHCSKVPINEHFKLRACVKTDWTPNQLIRTTDRLVSGIENSSNLWLAILFLKQQEKIANMKTSSLFFPEWIYLNKILAIVMEKYQTYFRMEKDFWTKATVAVVYTSTLQTSKVKLIDVKICGNWLTALIEWIKRHLI